MKIIEEIKRGGFARVEKVKTANGDIVARKVLDPKESVLEKAGWKKLCERFRREVRVQAQLAGDFVMPVLDADLDAVEPWFTMPLADRSYDDFVKEDRAKKRISHEPLAEILNGLDELHTLGYTHRDLKPANVLFHDGKWKLSDFGLVLPPGSVTTVTTSSAWVSSQYAAPELVKNFHGATAAADIYAFGCILHDLASGDVRIPYQRQTCKGTLGWVIEKCTEPSPGKRFKSIGGLRSALFAALASPTRTSPTLPAAQWVARLKNDDGWDVEQLDQLLRYLDEHEDDRDAVLAELNEDRVTAFYELDPDLADALGDVYCSWANDRAFEFTFCDVVVKRLEQFFAKSSLRIKAAAVLAVANMGSRHNRWFVMQRLCGLCGSSLDEQTARRIAIEIKAEEAQGAFRRSVERISRSVDTYHPLVRDAVKG